MADEIVTQGAPAPIPPLDAVLVWITHTIEGDLVRRGAFPELRRANASDFRGAACLHYLTPERAELLLADFQKQYVAKAERGLKTAYRAMTRALPIAIEEARGRPAMFNAPTPVLEAEGYQCEHWRGTKAGFLAMGLLPGGPWPEDLEPGKRFAKANDWRGYRGRIFRHSPPWPDLYRVTVQIPEGVYRQELAALRESAETAEKAEKARQSLQGMLRKPDDFRHSLLDILRDFHQRIVTRASSPYTWHAFTLDNESVEDLLVSFDSIAEAMARAKVRFDAQRHEEIERGHQATIAAADPGFQSALATIVALGAAQGSGK